MKYYIGIDNGVTGSVAVLDEAGKVLLYEPTPVREVLNYTKKKELIKRLDGEEFRRIVKPYAGATVVMERPMTNPKLQWKATVSAIRCDEAMLLTVEQMGLRHQYCDSRDWQKAMLSGLQTAKRATKDTTPEERKAFKAFNAKLKRQTKKLSLAMGQQLYPEITIKGDADALLIAEWARREKM